MLSIIAEVPNEEACLQLGRGSFGKVVFLNIGVDSELYAKCNTTGKINKHLSPFARPALKVSTSPENTQSLKREIDIHHRINLCSSCTRNNLLPGIPVTLVSQRDLHLYGNTFNAVLMPRMESNIYKYIRWRASDATPECYDELNHIVNEIHMGLKQLHSMKIIHADLSSSNVLINMGTGNENKPLDVRISDFGNCCFVGSDLKEFDKSEYVLYLHPDQFKTFNHSQRDSSKPILCCPPKANIRFDAWSYGIIVLDALMQFTRRLDRNINDWSKQNCGLMLHRLVTEDKARFAKRVDHVARVYASQKCTDENHMMDVWHSWRDIVMTALCIASPKGDKQQHSQLQCKAYLREGIAAEKENVELRPLLKMARA